MKINKTLFLVLAILGFLFIAIAGVFLILGVYMDYNIGIYVGLGLILTSIVFYLVLAIIVLFAYIRRKGGNNDKA
jgi:membrane protein DedA with SNARE-associated domain